MSQIRCQAIEPLDGTGPTVLTVDVEEWFHVCGVPGLEGPEQWASLPSRVDADVDRLLELFQRSGARATFFVLGWLAETRPGLVSRIAEAGHEIASHGHLHQPVNLLDPETFEEDLVRSLAVLHTRTGAVVSGYRAPMWSIGVGATPWAFEIMARHGITRDSSLIRAPVIGEPDHPREACELLLDTGGCLREFPPLAGRLFGVDGVFLGGAWPLRLFGPRRAIRAARKLTARGLPAVFFLHPWELDPDPPRFPMPRAQRFVHYAGLKRGRNVWETMLRELPFVSLGEAARSA